MERTNSESERLTKAERLFLLLFMLVLFEGAVRKYVAPGLEQALFFARVPIVAMLFAALVSDRRLQWSPGASALTVLLFGGALHAVSQLLIGGYSLAYVLIAGYGWSLTYMLVPVGLLGGRYLRQRSLPAIARVVFIVALLSLPLVILQYGTPPNSLWNSGRSATVGPVFATMVSARGVARTTGFFTSSLAQSHFIAIGFSFVGYALIHRPAGQSTGSARWLAMTAAFSLTVMTFLSGSRTAILLLAVVAAGLLPAFFQSSPRLRLRAATIAAMGGLALAAWPLVARNSFVVFRDRWNNAAAAESVTYSLGVLGRALYPLYAFVEHLWETPINGYLLGIAGGAAVRLSWASQPEIASQWTGPTAWAEDSWSAHIVETGPVFGLLAIAARIALAVYLVRRTWRYSRRSSDPRPYALLGATAYTVTVGLVNSQGSVSALGWLMVAVLLASTQLPQGLNRRAPQKATAA